MRNKAGPAAQEVQPPMSALWTAGKLGLLPRFLYYDGIFRMVHAVYARCMKDMRTEFHAGILPDKLYVQLKADQFAFGDLLCYTVHRHYKG